MKIQGMRRLGRVQRAASLALLAIALGGCAAGIKGRADPPQHLAEAELTKSVYYAQIQTALQTAKKAEAYYCSSQPTSCPAGEPIAGAGTDDSSLRRYRDDFIYSMMEAYDLALQDYARALSVEGRSFSFGAHLASLGLAAANTISPGETLGAITTAVLGIEKGYDAELLLGKAIPALIKQMEAAQSKQRSLIFEAMAQEAAEYPLTAARRDISALGAASTIETAIAAISERADDDKTEAEEAEGESRGLLFCATDAGAKLRSWINADKATSKAKTDQLRAFLDANGKPSVPVYVFLSTCEDEALQSAFVNANGIT